MGWICRSENGFQKWMFSSNFVISNFSCNSHMLRIDRGEGKIHFFPWLSQPDQVGDLTQLTSCTLENRPCISLDLGRRKMLTLLIEVETRQIKGLKGHSWYSSLCNMVVGVKERRPTPHSCCLELSRELTIPFTSCNIWDSEFCALSVHHSESDPVYKGPVSDPKNMTLRNLFLLLIFQVTAWSGKGCRCTTPLNVSDGRKRCPYGPKSWDLLLPHAGCNTQEWSHCILLAWAAQKTWLCWKRYQWACPKSEREEE